MYSDALQHRVDDLATKLHAAQVANASPAPATPAASVAAATSKAVADAELKLSAMQEVRSVDLDHAHLIALCTNAYHMGYYLMTSAIRGPRSVNSFTRGSQHRSARSDSRTGVSNGGTHLVLRVGICAGCMMSLDVLSYRRC